MLDILWVYDEYFLNEGDLLRTELGNLKGMQQKLSICPSSKDAFLWQKFSVSPESNLQGVLPRFKSSKMKHDNNPLAVSISFFPL